MTEYCDVSEQVKQAAFSVVKCILDEISTGGGNGQKAPEDTGCPMTEEIMRQAGAERIGMGDFRDVYRSGDCVIKVPRYIDGWIENAKEMTTWDMAPESMRKALAPAYTDSVTDYYIAMPFVDMEYEGIMHGPVDVHAIMRDVTKDISDSGYECEDITPTNIGMLKGKPVLIDYTTCMRKEGE